MNKKSEFNFKPSPVKKWSPTNPVEAKSIGRVNAGPPIFHHELFGSVLTLPSDRFKNTGHFDPLPKII